MKALSLILLLSLLTGLTTAQQNNIDSLKHELGATKNNIMRMMQNERENKSVEIRDWLMLKKMRQERKWC